MSWKYYDNFESTTRWMIPSRFGPKYSLPARFVAENDSGIKIGTCGKREYVAYFAYQHGEHVVRFFLDAKFIVYGEPADLPTLKVRNTIERATLCLEDIFAPSSLSDFDKDLFLKAVSDPDIFNTLIKMAKHKTYMEIKFIDFMPSIRQSLSKITEVKE